MRFIISIRNYYLLFSEKYMSINEWVNSHNFGCRTCQWFFIYSYRRCHTTDTHVYPRLINFHLSIFLKLRYRIFKASKIMGFMPPHATFQCIPYLKSRRWSWRIRLRKKSWNNSYSPIVLFILVPIGSGWDVSCRGVSQERILYVACM